jgi:hypothetical protein
MYTIADSLFTEEKLSFKIKYLPIYAYLPLNSGIKQE